MKKNTRGTVIVFSYSSSKSFKVVFELSARGNRVGLKSNRRRIYEEVMWARPGIIGLRSNSAWPVTNDTFPSNQHRGPSATAAFSRSARWEVLMTFSARQYRKAVWQNR
jgi:hypothetical protein